MKKEKTENTSKQKWNNLLITENNSLIYPWGN